MTFSNSFLAKCETLWRAGYLPVLDPGAFVGRGFADLGYEVFSVLPGDKMLSLFTGKITPITSDERGHLFSVPTSDHLIELIQSRYSHAVNLNTADGRSWSVIVGADNRIGSSVSEGSLTETLLDVAIEAYEGGNVQAK